MLPSEWRNPKKTRFGEKEKKLPFDVSDGLRNDKLN
jgi:hypothetical protein